jgi:hypothetical protein
LKREILVVNIKPTFSRERASHIIGIEYGLRPLHRDLDAMIKNLRDRQMHPTKLKEEDMLVLWKEWKCGEILL